MLYATLSGNLTKDPERVEYGKKKDREMIRFSVANNKSREETEYIECSVFDEKLIELISKYFKKGSRIICCGLVSGGHYTNKKGEIVDTMQMLVNHVSFN